LIIKSKKFKMKTQNLTSAELNKLKEVFSEEITETYNDLCEKYPENLDDPAFRDQVVQDILESKEDFEIESVLNY